MHAHTRKDRHSQRLGLLLIDFSRVRRRLSSATSNTQTCRALFFVLRCFDGVVLQHSNVVLPRRRSPERWLPFANSFIVVGLLSLRLLTSVGLRYIFAACCGALIAAYSWHALFSVTRCGAAGLSTCSTRTPRARRPDSRYGILVFWSTQRRRHPNCPQGSGCAERSSTCPLRRVVALLCAYIR